MTTAENTYDAQTLAKAKRALHVKKSDRESLWFLGDNVQIILDGSQTQGRLLLSFNHMAPGATPPLHEHASGDEILLLLEGEITFWTVGAEFTAGPGDAVLLPEEVPHTLQASPEHGAKYLLLVAPAGFEEFLRGLSEPATYDGPKRGWTLDDETASRIPEVSERTGIKIIGPPGARP